MTDEQKKAVTEWLGEPWYTTTIHYADVSTLLTCSRGAEGLPEPYRNRTFTTPDDCFACWEKLVEKNIVRKFLGYCAAEYMSNETIYDIYFPRLGFTNYLHSRTEDNTWTLCNLIAEAIKKGVL